MHEFVGIEFTLPYYESYASSCTPFTARPLGSFMFLKAASHARASAVEHATLGTLDTLRAALSLGKGSWKMLRWDYASLFCGVLIGNRSAACAICSSLMASAVRAFSVSIQL